MRKIPGIVGEVGMIVAAMGKVFAKAVVDIVPKTSGTLKRESDRWNQGGVIIPGFGD